GTPFETASTPVIAVQPFAKAVRSRNNVSGSCVDNTGSGATIGCTATVIARQVPTPMSTSVVTMKKYVGTEKIRPDSRMPRRLPSISTVTKASVISTRYTCHCGTADVIAATPAAMLTATVST